MPADDVDAPIEGEDVGRCGSLDLVASFELDNADAPPELPPATLDAIEELLLISAAATAPGVLAKCNCKLVGVDGCEANRGSALASNNDPEPPPIVAPLLLTSDGSWALAEPPAPVVVGVPECA